MEKLSTKKYLAYLSSQSSFAIVAWFYFICEISRAFAFGRLHTWLHPSRVVPFFRAEVCTDCRFRFEAEASLRRCFLCSRVDRSKRPQEISILLSSLSCAPIERSDGRDFRRSGEVALLRSWLAFREGLEGRNSCGGNSGRACTSSSS